MVAYDVGHMVVNRLGLGYIFGILPPVAPLWPLLLALPPVDSKYLLRTKDQLYSFISIYCVDIIKAIFIILSKIIITIREPGILFITAAMIWLIDKSFLIKNGCS